MQNDIVTLETVWQFLIELSIHLPCDLKVSLSGSGNVPSQRHVPKLKTTQMCINRKVDKQIVMYPYKEHYSATKKN